MALLSRDAELRMVGSALRWLRMGARPRELSPGMSCVSTDFFGGRTAMGPWNGKKRLLVTSATLVVTGALLVVTRSYLGTSALLQHRSLS